MEEENREIEVSQNEETTAEETKEEKVFELEAYTKKTWIKSLILGIFLGLAIVVPGISGAAVAIIFHLYDKLLYAIANILNKFKKCFFFLLPIIIGVIIGFAVGFLLVSLLLDVVPFGIVGFFAGLMVGAFPSVKAELQGDKIDKKKAVLLVLGIIVPLVIGAASVSLAQMNSDFELSYGLQQTATEDTVYISKFGDFPWWLYVAALPIGMVLGLTQVLPGLSATAFLMLIGFFRPLVDSVSLTYWKEYPQIFAFYVIMAVGLIIGFILTSKLMTALLKWNRTKTYWVVVGMSIGSIMAMFLNSDILGVYHSWAYMGTEGANTTRMIVDIVLFVPLATGGYFSSNLLLKKGSQF